MKTNKQIQSPQDRLLKSVRKIYKIKKDEIEKLKRCEKEFKRPDFLWFYLLQSFGTMGEAGGAERLIQSYADITYEALTRLKRAKKRTQKVKNVLREAHVRFPNRKADYIVGCFCLIKKMGGPKAAKQQLLEHEGGDRKIDFLQQFPGIGPKYARNLMMDVYHPDFRNYIAIDARITSISRCLGLAFTAAQYLEHQKFYLDVAKKAKLNGWELDRLLFSFNDEVKQSLNCVADRQMRKEESVGCH